MFGRIKLSDRKHKARNCFKPAITLLEGRDMPCAPYSPAPIVHQPVVHVPATVAPPPAHTPAPSAIVSLVPDRTELSRRKNELLDLIQRETTILTKDFLPAIQEEQEKIKDLYARRTALYNSMAGHGGISSSAEAYFERLRPGRPYPGDGSVNVPGQQRWADPILADGDRKSMNFHELGDSNALTMYRIQAVSTAITALEADTKKWPAILHAVQVMIQNQVNEVNAIQAILGEKATVAAPTPPAATPTHAPAPTVSPSGTGSHSTPTSGAQRHGPYN